MVQLPRDAQDAINSLDWGSISEEIGKKYLIDESEINDFQVETMLVLVGLEEAEAYARNIENNVGTSKEEAETIVNEAYNRIFSPIYAFLAEKIKNDLKNSRPKLENTVDFILSGGDYSAFLEDVKDISAYTPQTPARPVGSASIQNIKDRLIDINKK